MSWALQGLQAPFRWKVNNICWHLYPHDPQEPFDSFVWNIFGEGLEFMSKTEVIKLTSGASSLIHCQNRINEAHVVLNTSATNSDPNLLQVAWMPTGEVCLWHPPRKRNLLRRKVCDGTCVHRLGLKTQKWVPHDLMLYKLTSPWLKTLASFGAERGGEMGEIPLLIIGISPKFDAPIYPLRICIASPYTIISYYIVVWNMFDFSIFWE